MQTHSDPFNALAPLETSGGTVSYYRLDRLSELGAADISRLPYSVKVLLENLLRRYDGRFVTENDVLSLARWNAADPGVAELPFLPARVLLQDFTGIPVVADLAALRDEMKRLGGDPERVNPAIPVDLVIDHSVQVDVFGSPDAYAQNVDLEYERNKERYTFLKWAQRAFRNLQVVPPGAGIVHQVNLEFLAKVVQTRTEDGRLIALPDTLVGTDSHTTMINGLGVLGWGVGGIEAEAAMLNQPLPLLAPEVIGMRLTGSLREGVTATDLVLTITQILRKRGVVGKFVEYCGPGLSNLALADRATIANMSPEYGATVGYFPVDEETLRFLRLTGRDAALIDLVEKYCRAQGLFRENGAPDPVFTDLLELDLDSVESSLAGPRRPQDRVPLGEVPTAFRTAFEGQIGVAETRTELAATATVADTFPASDPMPAQSQTPGGSGSEVRSVGLPASAADLSTPPVETQIDAVRTLKVGHGSVAIAAITSCTNTSNPSVMIGAGLLAKKAVERGLTVSPSVKTSLAPGSRAVVGYLERAGLLPHLEALRFNLVGFGCTTCIGNSGPLPEIVAKAVDDESLVVAAVLSGNRNFEGRIHPQVRASYLASPPLVVAYALAGSVNVDLTTEPLGIGKDGQPVYLKEIWPSSAEVSEALAAAVNAEVFRETYAHVFDGDERWRALPVPEGALYEWDENSTYLRKPPFVENLSPEPPHATDIRNAKVLAMLGDSVTTDHISPAGSIAASSPAGKYLQEHGVPPREFNSYGSRRGNHEVMVRGTFANVRLRNQLAPGTEGGVTTHVLTGEQMPIYDASVLYQDDAVPLIVIGGKEYGSGSSRDWAAKGVALLGVKAVIVESYERIHRSNLIGMGIMPLEFMPGDTRESLGLDGTETFSIEGIDDYLEPRQHVTVHVRRRNGTVTAFEAIERIDTPIEVQQYLQGGILPFMLRKLVRES